MFCATAYEMSFVNVSEGEKQSASLLARALIQTTYESKPELSSLKAKPEPFGLLIAATTRGGRLRLLGKR